MNIEEQMTLLTGILQLVEACLSEVGEMFEQDGLLPTVSSRLSAIESNLLEVKVLVDDYQAKVPTILRSIRETSN